MIPNQNMIQETNEERVARINAAVEAEFAKRRAVDRKLNEMSGKHEKLLLKLKNLWAEYQLKAQKLQIRMANQERQIKVEETYLRRTIRNEIEVGIVDHDSNGDVV